MRILGWALIIAGFFWLMVGGVVLQGIGARNVVIRTFDSLPQKDNFSKEEVKALIGKACQDTEDESGPKILEPSLMMLLGSIIISLNKRINNDNKK